MQVFVTGGTGLIGSAVVAELLAHGHSVLALARSADAERTLQAAGAETLRGGVSDPDLLRDGAVRTDGVIHLAFDHSAQTAETLAAAIEEERVALATLGEVLLGSDRPLVMASGTPFIEGRLATEADPLATDGPVGGRARSVLATLELASRGVRSSVVRVSRTTHNEGRGGFAGVLTDVARRTGVAGYPGDGSQRWPAVHALDAAALFRLALERAPGGTSWHAVADEGDQVRDIAAVIGRRLGLEVASVPQDSFGPLGPIFAMDTPASSAHTRATLGWEPTHVGLLEDLENLRP